ncbi:uncharacterized protein LOC34618359 [Cyclospora cayetanensis]|uniref:Uncharacterized protein LOC34618359 n=1 Tax=Cyclospora cayetanensis TaxID=88456 RepID=A0A6P6S217_9EIME|nr:uncharacterized protein LOC34618359 [Cyclospora cayetanensis]
MQYLIIGALCLPASFALEFSVVSESSSHGPPDVCSDELYAFHTSTSSWEYVYPRGDSPSARGGASLNAVRGSLILFGGESNDGTYNDIYKFESRSGHASASDGEKIYIFGGFNEASHLLSPSLSVTNLESMVRLTGHSAVRNGSDTVCIRFHSYCCSDVWRLDARSYTWTLLSAGDPKFAPRERHGAVILSGVGCEIDILGAEERARRAQGAKRLPHEHPTPDLSALMNSDLREQTMAIWRDIVREAGGVRSTSMEILGRPQRRILQSLPPAGQIGELRGSASVEGFGKAADSREGGLNPSQRTCFSIMDNIHRPQLQEDLSTGASTGLRPNCHVRHLISYALSICLLKNVIPAVAEIKEALQALTDELQEGLPSISGSVRAAMAPVSLAVGLGTLYGMYRVNRSRL